MEILVGLVDSVGAPVTGRGANIALKIRRSSNGYLYDWGDSTFKASGWTTLSQSMSEVNAVSFAGFYNRNVTTTGWADGWYTYSYAATLADSSIVSDIGEVYILNGLQFEEAIIGQIWGRTVDGSLTAEQVMRLLLSVLAGKSNGGGSSTIHFRDSADSKNRISATVDTDGNRTAITLDAS